MINFFFLKKNFFLFIYFNIRLLELRTSKHKTKKTNQVQVKIGNKELKHFIRHT